jgi:hypothetical protein
VTWPAFASVRAFLPVAFATLSRVLPFSRCGKLPPLIGLRTCRSFAAAFSSGSMARLIATASAEGQQPRDCEGVGGEQPDHHEGYRSIWSSVTEKAQR